MESTGISSPVKEEPTSPTPVNGSMVRLFIKSKDEKVGLESSVWGWAIRGWVEKMRKSIILT